MSRRQRLLAWSLIGAGVALILTTVFFSVLDSGHHVVTRDTGGSDGVFSTISFMVPILAFLAVGGLLAVRRPGNPVGWLCLIIGVLWVVVGAQDVISKWAFHRGMPTTAGWVGTLGSLWVVALGLLGTHLPLRLPGGSLLSARWRGYSRFCTAVIVLTLALVSVDPASMNNLPGVENPFGIPGLEPLAPLFVLFPLSLIGAIGSLVVRFRRARGVERLQMRWIALGGLACVGIYVASFPLAGLTSGHGAVHDAIDDVAFAAFAGIPVAVGISVLRYRLYDLGVVFNRALVYGVLTASLAAVYVGTVLLLQLALGPITRDSGLAVAVSTLAVAALFRPARARIQAAVDRRFFRHKYDATRTLEAFSDRLRDEVDLDSLGEELRWVVRETMQPAQVSLWLREPTTTP